MGDEGSGSEEALLVLLTLGPSWGAVLGAMGCRVHRHPTHSMPGTPCPVVTANNVSAHGQCPSRPS